MNTDKTLADVQPGGMVRLGDARALIQRYDAAGAKFRESLMDDRYSDAQRVELRRELTAVQDELLTALSAQPSLGGQGDAPFAFSERAKANALEAGQYAFTEADGEDLGYTACIEACVDAICRVLELLEHRAYLAARQPVDEVSVKKEDANNYCLILRALGMEEEGDPVAEVQALIEARDRQPVGEPVCTDCGTQLLFECTGCSRSNYPPVMQGPIGEIVYSGEGVLQIEFYDGKPLAPMKLYADPTANSVGLEQFRPFVEAQRAEYISHGLTEQDYCVAECDDLLALIDRHSVANK